MQNITPCAAAGSLHLHVYGQVRTRVLQMATSSTDAAAAAADDDDDARTLVIINSVRGYSTPNIA